MRCIRPLTRRRVNVLRALLISVATLLVSSGTQASGSVLDRLETQLAQQLAGEGVDLVELISLDTQGLIPLKASDVQLELVGGDLNLAALRLAVEWKLDGQREARVMTAAVVATVEVAVVVEALAPGDALGHAVTLERRQFDGPIHGLVTAATFDEHQYDRARRRLQSGALLRRADLRESQAVRLGDRVSVTTRFGGVALKLEATALSAADVGDAVPIQVFSTGRRIEALVVGPGQVSVMSGGGRS